MLCFNLLLHHCDSYIFTCAYSALLHSCIEKKLCILNFFCSPDSSSIPFNILPLLCFPGRLQPVTHLQIVLVGAKGSGKTSTLNRILGRGSVQGRSRTARCEVAAGVVFGRQVTVVDTPGWWMNYFSEETPAFERRELLRSLTLCPPGPHVLLLVVRADRAFTETYRRAVQEHLQLLSPNIWSRVILLLSCGDCVGDGAEQYLESEGDALQWLVHRCEDRYHVLDNTCTADGFQVRELIGKIEELVADRGGQHFELEGKVVERMEMEVRRERERVKERLRRKEQQRQKARAQLGECDASDRNEQDEKTNPVFWTSDHF